MAPSALHPLDGLVRILYRHGRSARTRAPPLPSDPIAAMTQTASFKGNKSALPAKPCMVCGRQMTWRKRWERVWDEVRFCSNACRLRRRADG